MTKITKGCYVKTSEIKDTEEWKKVIDAFVQAGFYEYEGYSEDASACYLEDWSAYKFVGVDYEGDVVHYDGERSYSNKPRLLPIQEVLSGMGNTTPIEYLFVNDLSINMNQTKEERVSELGQEGWILGGIEPTGTYVFYREKS